MMAYTSRDTQARSHTHIKINVMTNEFDFEMMRDSYRGGEFKLRAKLITENYWSEKITLRNDRQKSRKEA